MAGPKTRPDNNFHCFEGAGYGFWKAIAQGMRPTGMSNSPDGYQLDYAKDVDGSIVHNGGMFAPQEVKLKPGNYFRFFGTASKNVYGAKSSMAGGWWLDYDNFVKVGAWAEEHDISLARAAQALLVIPKEWHDCGYVGRARLSTTMKAWVGKGKPATGSISPDSAKRDKATTPVTTAPTHLEMKQYFVPGERELLKGCFKLLNSQQVIRKGTGLPQV
ncbi:hypothetical protein [uncultured Litoreibacter sp.]|uniref:hypothetical protein n=1 Tax=uncultured Litoreibacter sp. TaxID=1392394 RepID=UPI00262C2E69|nr:hypothetical protein [uncultured Litoreibacter sp.]